MSIQLVVTAQGIRVMQHVSTLSFPTANGLIGATKGGTRGTAAFLTRVA